MKAALIVTGESRAETIADNNSKTVQYIPLIITVYFYHPPQLCPPKNDYNIIPKGENVHRLINGHIYSILKRGNCSNRIFIELN